MIPVAVKKNGGMLASRDQWTMILIEEGVLKTWTSPVALAADSSALVDVIGDPWRCVGAHEPVPESHSSFETTTAWTILPSVSVMTQVALKIRPAPSASRVAV